METYPLHPATVSISPTGWAGACVKRVVCSVLLTPPTNLPHRLEGGSVSHVTIEGALCSH